MVIFICIVFISMAFSLFGMTGYNAHSSFKKGNNVHTSVLSISQKSYLRIGVGSVIVFLISLIIIAIIPVAVPNSEKTSDYNQMNNSQTESSKTVTEEVKENTCSICGRKFKGNGYEEASEGIWKPCSYPYQCYVCSPECGRKHTAEVNKLLDKVDQYSGEKCVSCGFGHYVNGFCNYCGVASPTTVERHQANYPKCEMCNGTGFVNSYDGYKVCPSCKGTGKQTY
ncbi:MAG: hypothetical protein JWN78_3105 [Bacteroidota bacterium]|nr:hypothetical protein [Bacteroidota bacterium]